MTAPRKAVIVAAGRSSRLYPLTLELPKSLLQVAGDTIIGRSVRLLREHGIEEVAIVAGYQREKIQAHFNGAGLVYLHNPFFFATNNLGSLWFARDWVGDDGFLYLHADIVYHPDLLRRMMAAPDGIGLLVEMGRPDEEAMKVRLESGRFIESKKAIPPAEASGEWVGIARFPSSPPVLKQLFHAAERVFEAGDCNAYDTAAFSLMAREGADFRIIPTGGLPWIEIDDQADLARARALFP